MAQQNNEQEQTEQATPFKLEEARKKGIVAKSVEINSASALLAALLCVTAFAGWCIPQTLQLSRRIFGAAGHPILDRANTMHLLTTVGETALFILSPLLALLVGTAILSNFVQTGPVFSGEPLKPDLSRINPATGLKRLFSGRALFEAVKAIVKLSLYVGIASAVLHRLIPSLTSLYHYAPSAYPKVFVETGNRLLFQLVLAVAVVAIIDLIYTRSEFARRMRMSRRELKEEIKRREGDPQVRSKRRELQRQLRTKASAIRKVKESDVLITNPTHYAVAVKYRRGEAQAPEVLAKGAGEIARKMRDAAFRHGIAIVSDPRLARDLYRDVEIGQMIPEKHYDVVATVLSKVYESRRHRQAQREQR